MPRNLFVAAFGAAVSMGVLTNYSCGGCPTGAESCSCTETGSCDAGLSCMDSLCVGEGGGTAGETTGAMDGEATADSAGDGDAGDGDGDGDGDGSAGDGSAGDGDGSAGDGDGTSAGDGDGDGTSAGDGDGTSAGDGDGTSAGDGDGDGTSGGDGDGTSGDGDGCADSITMIVRDFSQSHPDFEHPPWPEPWGPHSGIVEPNLGPDNKPVIVEPLINTIQWSTADNFRQWYNTDPSPTNPYNHEFIVQLPLTPNGPGVLSYDDAYFHPIGPNDGFGSEGYVEQEGPDIGIARNWHFTTETTLTFEYQGGEVLTFRGDDDFWGFIDGRLVIDLGGVHGPATQVVSLDTDPNTSQLVIGNSYQMKFFHAERRHWGSSFRIDTSAFCITPQ